MIANNWIKIFVQWINKFKDLNNLKNLCKVLAVSNLICCCCFYVWYTTNTHVALDIFFYSLIFVHYFIAILFLKYSFIYEGSKWVLWGWLSLIICSPFGVVLFYYCSFPLYWEIDEEKSKNKTLNTEYANPVFNNNLLVLEKQWFQAKTELKKLNAEVFDAFTSKVLKINSENFSDWNIYQISTIIAMFLTIKQFKQKTFDNFLWQPQWYDEKHFTFALKNPLPINKKNPHPIAMGIIVLDELNNYQKILDAKVEIKNNLKFSRVKMICLHWGKEYKIYTNI